jgi:hypothetical protein
VAPQNQSLNRLFKAGLLLFCLAGLSRLFLHATSRIPVTVMESVIGFLYGISVALLIAGTITQRNGDCRLKACPLEEK